MAYVENEVAYNRAVKARIMANAYKTWIKNNPRYEEIESFIETGRVYNGNGKNYKENFAGSLAQAFDIYGKLSEKQCEAVLKIVDANKEKKAVYQAALAEQKAKSDYLGVASEKVRLKLKVDAVIILEAVKFSYYDIGVQYLVSMSDESGNRVVYKSKTKMAYKYKAPPENYGEEKVYIKAGMTVYVDASIKALVDYKGEKQTIIQRPNVKGIEYKQGSLKEDIDKTQ